MGGETGVVVIVVHALYVDQQEREGEKERRKASSPQLIA